MLPVGHRRVRRPRRGLVRALVWLSRHNRSPPNHRAGLPVDCHYGELMVKQRIQVVVRAVRCHAGKQLFWTRHLGRGDKNQAPPNHRRRVAQAGQFGFPSDIFCLTPLHGWVGLRRHPSGQRPPPLPPLRKRIDHLPKHTRRDNGEPNGNKQTVWFAYHNEDLLPPTLPRPAPDINSLGQAAYGSLFFPVFFARVKQLNAYVVETSPEAVPIIDNC